MLSIFHFFNIEIFGYCVILYNIIFSVSGNPDGTHTAYVLLVSVPDNPDGTHTAYIC